MGARDSGRAKEIHQHRTGRPLKDHRLATRDIFKDLKKNLSRAGLLEAVTLINGSSFDEKTIATVREMARPGEIGLFIFDADANVRRDIDCYGDRFAHGCWVVIDDYISATDKGRPDPDPSGRTGRARGVAAAGILRLGDLGRPMAVN